MKSILSAAPLAIMLTACEAEAPRAEVAQIAPAVETVQVQPGHDDADDPAIWIAPNPADSLVLGADKASGVAVFALDGSLRQFLAAGRINNIDVRQGVSLGGETFDIAAGSDRSNLAAAVFFIDRSSGELSVAPGGILAIEGFADPYGACLYVSPRDGAVYVFVSDKDPGTVVQVRLDWDGAAITGEEVRRFSLGTISEGCVADDRTGLFYIAQEDEAVWRFGAEPGDGGARDRIAEVDGAHITADAEGVAILPRGATGGWLIVSSQGDSSYTFIDLETLEIAGRFGVGPAGEIDMTSSTDGLDVYGGSLGPAFPHGLFVVQDDEDDIGGANYKFVDLAEILDALGLARE